MERITILSFRMEPGTMLTAALPRLMALVDL